MSKWKSSNQTISGCTLISANLALQEDADIKMGFWQAEN